ncbi:MAG: ABC transporter permease [Clostridia bacterium]|nr:ABC transporter permease [Clostridia bacterium]
MKKYVSFFKIRFQTGLQYRASYVSALATQLPWGLMECLAYVALHETNAAAFPMELQAVVGYIWLKEAFLVLFNTWNADNDIFGMIIDGGISYELCRPISLYDMWFARNAGGRLSTAATRCVPILLVALLLPKPFALTFGGSVGTALLFLAAMALGLGVTIAFCMIVYMLCFFTLSPKGLRRVLVGAVDLLSGNVIPLPFIPQPWRRVFELMPFGSMQNVPFRIFTGDLAGAQMVSAMALQMFWLIALILLGRGVCALAQRRTVIQGG